MWLPTTALLLLPVVAAAAAPPIRVDPAMADPPFQGWGVSLCWWAHVAGGYPEPARSRLMGRVFSLDGDGLGLNLVRYNIGGGENPAEHFLRPRAAVPGYEPSPGRWDWSADANQRWVLADAIRRGVDHVQAFSNSPPYWMTRSGSASGGDGGAENLRPDQFEPFADYLVAVTAHFHDAWHVTFDTLEPLNEPASPWWRHGNWQEGCRFDRPAQDRLVRLLARRLGDRRLPTAVAAADENSIDAAARSFLALSDPARDALGLLTTHSYGGTHRTALAEVARGFGKPLWMSEYGDADPTGLQMAERIVADLRGLHPAAWVAWQVADPAGGWGFFRADLDAPADTRWHENGKFAVMAQFARHLRPGCRLVETGDPHAVAAVDGRSRTLTIVAVNAADAPAQRTYDLSRFTTLAGHADAWRTSPTERLAPLPPLALAGTRLACPLPPRSVSTFVLPATTYAGPPPPVDPNVTYALRDDAHRWLCVAPAAGSRVTTTADPAAAARWGFLRTDEADEAGGRWAIYDRAAGLSLDVAAASPAPGTPVLHWPDHDGPGQRWCLLPVAAATYALRNPITGLSLDASDPAGTVQSPPSDTPAQRWHLIPTP